MEDLVSISKKNIEKAFEIIAGLKIREIWESVGSVCYLVGSVRTGLLMDKLDIDFHVYSDDFSIGKSFDAISQISQNPKIKEVTYQNLLDAEDMCLEWHLWYKETPGSVWTIDIMHIKNESAYAGVIERVTEKIKAAVTESQKQRILEIKSECYRRKEEYLGIDLYQAVMAEGIETFEEFKMWKQNKKDTGISLWEPDADSGK